MWGGTPNHFRQVALPGVHIKRRCAGLKNYMALKSQYRWDMDSRASVLGLIFIIRLRRQLARSATAGFISGLRLPVGGTSARSKTIALSPHLGLLLGSWW